MCEQAAIVAQPALIGWARERAGEALRTAVSAGDATAGVSLALGARTESGQLGGGAYRARRALRLGRLA